MSIRGKRVSPPITKLFNLFTNIKLVINTAFKKYCFVCACMCVCVCVCGCTHATGVHRE